MEYEQAISAYICRYCKGSFDHLENLQKHVQQIHTPRSKKQGKNSKELNCPLCGLWCVKYETYRDHLKHIHRQAEEGKTFMLKCFNDFYVWKNELEKRNYCKYVMQGPPKVIHPSEHKLHVYRCDSSTPTLKERQSTCSSKDTCPSTISVVENAKNHSIKVEHWNTHVGHAIPVNSEELDAAIGSLQTAEIVVDEQSYQSVDQNSENAIYFLTESNDGSFSESYVKETQKKPPPALFQNNGDSSSNQTSKSTPRNFSFKKDPSKKSLSFSGSLASVACMKASAKKNVPTPTTSVTSIDIESTCSQSTPITVASIETSDSQSTSDALSVEHGEKKINKEKYTKNSKTNSKSKKLKNKEKNSISSSTSSTTSQSLLRAIASIPSVSSSSQIKAGASPLKESVLSNLKLMVNDGKLNGQFILLNSLQGQNGQQNLILCPVDKNMSSVGLTTATETKGQDAKQKGKGQSPKLQQSSKSLLKPSPVPEVLTLDEKTSCSAGEEIQPTSETSSLEQDNIIKQTVKDKPNPSTSKKSEKQDMPIELKTSSISQIPKARKRVTGKKTVSIGKKLKALEAASSISDVLNKAGTKIVPNTVSPSVKSIMINSPMATSPKPSPVVGNKVLANSFTGVSYIQINNTLFPINSPAGPNLNSNFTFTSPISLAQNIRPSQPVKSFSALAPQATTTLIMNTTQSSVVRTTAPNNTKSNLPNNNMPMVLISPLGNNSGPVPISPLSFVAAQKPIGKTAAPSPMVMQTLSNSVFPQIGKMRSPLIQTNAQFIPSPRLLAVGQPFIRHAGPTSFGVRGMQPISLIAANTPQGNKRMRLPSSSTPKPTKTILKSINVNSIVSNTNPISSTPAITIPSTPIAHPQKPGAFIFESSGDLYVLEPIQNTTRAKTVTTTVGKDKDKEKISKAQSDIGSLLIDSDAVENTNVLAASPNIEAKVEFKPKRPKVRPTFSDGNKIATLPQKRRMKEDDSEILKKIKYYDMEMKYLSSQAECKRLKLELARIHMKDKTPGEVQPMILDEDFLEEKEMTDVVQNMTSKILEHPSEDTDEHVIDQLTDSLLKQIEKIEFDKKLIIDDDLHSKSTDQSTDNELKANVELSFKEQINKKVDEIEMDEHPVDYEVCCDKSKDKDVNNQEIEVKAIHPSEVEEQSESNFVIENKSTVNNELLVASVGNSEAMDRTIDNSQTEDASKFNDKNFTSINNSETIDNNESDSEIINKCIDSLKNQPEISNNDIYVHEDFTILDDQIKTTEESSKHEEFYKEQVMETDNLENNQYTNVIDDNQNFDSTKSNEHEVLDHSCEKKAVEETLKELEIKYGDGSDIYTMIRTSVLRSLYADMKEVCQENKKLFEELQSLKNKGESYEVVDVGETQIEQL